MKEYFNGFSTQDLVDMRRNDEKRKEKVEMEKEIERLKDDNKYLNKVNIELSSKKNRLKSIIKEVREYINKISSEPNVFGHYAIDGDCKKVLLKILDKKNRK